MFDVETIVQYYLNILRDSKECLTKFGLKDADTIINIPKIETDDIEQYATVLSNYVRELRLCLLSIHETTLSKIESEEKIEEMILYYDWFALRERILPVFKKELSQSPKFSGKAFTQPDILMLNSMRFKKKPLLFTFDGDIKYDPISGTPAYLQGVISKTFVFYHGKQFQSFIQKEANLNFQIEEIYDKHDPGKTNKDMIATTNIWLFNKWSVGETDLNSDEILGIKDAFVMYRLFKTHYCNFEINDPNCKNNFFGELVELFKKFFSRLKTLGK